MNKKLKIALKSRPSEQGFAIPIAVGLGLVMILIAATMIVRSQGDQVIASAQKVTARSLATAETGTTRVQSLLNRYRVLANITLTNIATTPPSSSWKQAYGDSPVCGAGGVTTEISGYGLNQQISLGSGGQFRVTKYKYRPSINRAQVTGGVTIPASASVVVNISPANYLADGASVDGRIEDIQGTLSRSGTIYTFQRLLSGTETTTTGDFVPGPSDPAQFTSGITIPANGSISFNSTVISPANYLADGASVDGQIQGIKGTLSRSGTTYTFKRLISGTATTTTTNFFPTTTPGIGTLEVEGQTGTATSHLQVSIPVQAGDINTVPVPGLWLKSGGMSGGQKVQGNIILNDCSVTASPTTYQDIDPTTNKPYIDPNTGAPYKTLQHSVIFPNLPSQPSPIPNTLTFSKKSTFILPDTTNDIASTKNGKTVYEYYVTNIPAGANITITSGQKVIFYLNGNIEKGTDITHSCPLDVSGNKLPGCDSTDFKIFGYGSSGSYVCLNGNNHIDAFIFAPDYSAGVNGGGSGGGFYGSLWVKDFTNAPSCSSSSSHTVVFQSADWTSLGLTPKNLPPTITPISSWQRQEASP